MKKNLGLALSGGGSKGLIHVGALQFFEENKIEFNTLSGTSAGSIVAGLYACRKKPHEILSFFENTQMFSPKHLGLSMKGFINTPTLRDEFENTIGNPKIEDLDKILKIVASNMLDGTIKVFDKGNLIDAILASSAYPGIFTPMKIEKIIYCDGGMVNNFPIDLITNETDASVGINLSSFEKKKYKDLNNVFDLLTRSFDIMSNIKVNTKKDMADVYLTPSKGHNLGTFDTNPKVLANIFEIGYEYTQSYFKKNPDKLSFLKNA